MKKVGRAYGRGCAQAVLIRLIVTVVVVGVAVAAIAIGAVVPLPVGTDRGLAVAISLGAGLLGVLAVTIAGSALVVWRRGRFLDAAFPPGVPGRRWNMPGRQWHGSYRGRQLDAWFSRGPHLEIYLSGRIGSRFKLARRSELLFVAGGAREIDLPGLGALAFAGAEPDWVAARLGDPAVRSTIARLLGEGEDHVRVVEVLPDGLGLQMRFIPVGSISAELVERALVELSRLVAELESGPPPGRWVQPTVLETTNRTDRDRYFWPAVLIVLVVIGVPVLLMGALVAVMLVVDL